MKKSDLIKKIESLMTIDTNNYSIKDIKKLIEPISENYFTPTPLIEKESSFYRTVKLPNDKKPELFKDIIYPPKEFTNYYQRVNRPGNPVFYCSTSKKAAIIEGRYNVNDKIAISEWEVNDNSQIVPVNVGYTNHLTNWSDRKNIPSWTKKLNIERTESELENNEIIKDFFSFLFCQNFDENHRYKLSIAISEILGFNTESENSFKKIGHQEYKGNLPFDAILFPSIMSNGNTDNLAIRRHSFHQKIKLVSVDYCLVKEISNDSFEYEELDFANSIDENEEIEWKGRKGNFTLPPNAGATLTKVGKNKFEIKRKDGKKMYRS